MKIVIKRMAQLIGEGIGRSVAYVQVPLGQVKHGMLQAGIPPAFADYIMDMYAEQAAGRADPAEPRSAETTSKTSLLDFAREVIKPAVDAAASR